MRKSTIVITLILIFFLFILWLTFSLAPAKEDVVQEKPQLETIVLPQQEVENEPEPNIMEVTATAYCPCKECSDEWGNKTSTGAIAKEGRTIAVDPKIIPYGTEVIIDGHTYYAEDCGGLIKGNMIDIYFDSHEKTELWGRKNIEIVISRTGNQ